ncbi:MAG TPA: hypothetical protein PKE20_06675 [Promineifilum sp.]|nr:hypothetical protein [Promineifilum sp.]
MKRRLLIFVPVLLVLLMAATSVMAAVFIDSNGQLSFYARVPRDEIITDGEWVAVVFYRPASCIPAEFNMLDFFDFPNESGPGAFGCNPPTTDSVEWWENGPGVDMAPLSVRFRGLGAVPVWFVTLSELEAATSDDVLTIDELEALPSLRKGSAKYYRELVRPWQNPANGLGTLWIVARGNLEDGGRFRLYVSLVDIVGGEGVVRIRLR